MDFQHEAAVRGILAGAPRELGIKNVKVEGSNLREVIKTILKDEFASLRKNRLTWKADQLEPPPDPKLQIGKLRKDGKPYIGPIGAGKYYIQNGEILSSAGQPVSTDVISRIQPLVKRPDGTEVTYRSDWELVNECLSNYLRTALALDPNLCPYCARYSTATRMDYMRHVYKEHPKEFVADAEGEDESRMDMMADFHGEARVPMPQVEIKRGPGRPRKEAEQADDSPI